MTPMMRERRGMVPVSPVRVASQSLANSARSAPMARMLEISICSYSFHRLLAAGKQDIFKYISDCAELGCTQLDPWNAHLANLQEGDAVLSAADADYIAKVEEAADVSGL